MAPSPLAAAVVLAAGKGSRMHSALPKVLHPLGGRSLLGHALAAVAGLGVADVAVVVRHERDRVAAEALRLMPGAVVADQDDVPGTGRAFACGLAALDARWAGAAPETGRVLVTYGDVPLLRTETLRLLAAGDPDAAVCVLTARVPDPTGYGRVVRGDDGRVQAIVEHRDADERTLRITEINTGVYVIDLRLARSLPGRLRPSPSGELYLTDVVAMAREDGSDVTAVEVVDVTEVEGVNDRVQLAGARRRLNDRLLDAHMRAGVDVVDPATTWVDVTATFEADARLLPGTHIEGSSHVAAGAVVGPATTLLDSRVDSGAAVVRSHLSGAVVGPGAQVGPFSYLRPGSVVGAAGKVGAYVETKNAVLGAGAKVPHLSYVGDAEVGEGANIGAGTIVANYDGVAKHRTHVGAHARVGSNTVLVAPVEVGDGAYTAAGSVVDVPVPPGALAVARGRLHISEDWVARRRPGSPADEAALAAARASQVDAPVVHNGATGAFRTPHDSEGTAGRRAAGTTDQLTADHERAVVSLPTIADGEDEG